MEIEKFEIEGPVVIKPRVFNDMRGYFYESYNKLEFDKLVEKVDFVQDNQSMSTYGVVRGLHFQRPPFTQAKLVRCIKGRVLDVAVDLRKDSPTFGKSMAVELSEENKLQFFIPRGFAHGFSVLSEEAIFQYKCDNYYAPEADGGIDLSDESLGIDWGIPKDKMIISDKDKKHQKLGEIESPF